MKKLIVLVLAATSLYANAQSVPKDGKIYASGYGARTSGTLNSILTSIGSADARIVLDVGAWSITNDVTFPSNVAVEVPHGSSFSIATNIVVTVNGGFEAGVHGVFTGPGTAAGAALFPYRYEQWGDTNQFNIGTGQIHFASSISTNDYVTTATFYDTLQNLNLATFTIYNYTTAAAYFGAVSKSPTNADMQSWTVPDTLTTNQIINVHLWGGGGSYGTCGYTYGEFVVVATNDFVATNATHVTTGMVLRVQVGSARGRAAIWRDATANFNSYTNELLVAGGGGGPPAGVSADTTFSFGIGEGGGTNGVAGYNNSTVWIGSTTGGGGGTQSAGGAGGSASMGGGGHSIIASAAGERVWGAYQTRVAYFTYHYYGGDGYYGGGTGGRIRYFSISSGSDLECSAAGGGGSGYIQSGITGSTTSSSGSAPAGTTEAAYGSNAGYAGNPGRVVFEVIFGNDAE